MHSQFTFGSALKKIRDARLYKCKYDESGLARLAANPKCLDIIIAELEDDSRLTNREVNAKSWDQKAARFLLLIAHESIMKPQSESDRGPWFQQIVNLVRAYHEVSLVESPPRVHPKPESFIYFIEASGTGFIKIGHSFKRERLNNLQIGCPFPLKMLATCPGGRKQEIELHARFSHLRERGEWFRVDSNLSAYIQSITERFPQ